MKGNNAFKGYCNYIYLYFCSLNILLTFQIMQCCFDLFFQMPERIIKDLKGSNFGLKVWTLNAIIFNA